MHAPDVDRSPASLDVLVVIDDQNVRDTVAAALETEGYHVECAGNGAEALALMLRYRPEAIVLDLAMPVMTGWELLEAVNQRGDLREIPVVVVSAMHAPDGVVHLEKPVSLEDLVATLERLCQQG
jgi:CheY-like chemotaxis protein